MDLNGDGKFDILSGSWPGELYLFQGLGNGKFAGGEQIKDQNGKPIKLGSASTVFAHDWNGDGKLDLLVGDIDGSVHLLLNGGTAKEYAFGTATKLEADGKRIEVAHGDAHPIAHDWDGDGKLDLLVGCGDGSVLFFQNSGTATEPKLAAAVTLVPPARRDPTAKVATCGMRAKICVADWNRDGKPDLLVGDYSHVTLEQGQMTAEDRKAIEEAKKKLPELQKAHQEVLQQWQPLAQPARKKETAEEEKARKEKLDAVREKMQQLLKQMQEPRLAYSKLVRLEQEGKLSDEQKKELEGLKERMQTFQKEYQEFVQKEYVPVAQPPVEETPEQAGVRLEKLKPVQEKMQKIGAEMGELNRIIYRFERPQLCGSVWLYLRQ